MCQKIRSDQQVAVNCLTCYSTMKVPSVFVKANAKDAYLLSHKWLLNAMRCDCAAGRSVVKIIVAVDRHFKHCNIECSSGEAAVIVAHIDSILRRRPSISVDQHANSQAVKTSSRYDAGRQRHRST